MLILKNLNKVYKMKKTKIHAVNNVDLTFNRGEFISILGYSGSGKTTLVSLIGGLEEPSYGTFLIDGIDTSQFKKSQWTDYRKNTIGFVFQDFNLISHLTAIDNIKIALSLSGNSEEDKEKRATELLEMVNMSKQRDQYPAQLSGGQQQRIAIARALANNPEIILADEPTGALDPKTSKQIMMLLQTLANKGHLVIMVTHNEKIAYKYSSRIVEIENGCILKDSVVATYNKQNLPSITMTKSSLQFSTALRVALNNLKIRRNSTVFAIMSLIPSIILLIVLGNFVFNLNEYQDDIEPIYNNILNDDQIHFISKLDETDFYNDLNNLMIKVSKKINKAEDVAYLEQLMFAPYSDEEIDQIEALDFVEKVFKPSYFDVEINGEHFILTELLPEAYKAYQYDFDFGYYPSDGEQGLIFSTEAAKLLLGKYTKDPYAIEHQNLTFEIKSFNSLPLHYDVFESKRNVYEAQVIKVFDPEVKTTLMSSYYKGYIYAPYDYIEEIRASYSARDISIITYEKVDTVSPNGEVIEFYPVTYSGLTDLIAPLRAKTMIQEDMDLFSFKEYPEDLPSNNFMMRHKIITNRTLTQKEIEQLSYFGVYYNSQYDAVAIDSAKNTNDYIKKMLLYATVAVSIIVAIPSVLVALILYISIILRTKEIGVLKSIGAKSKDIMTIFTLEAGLLACSSGIVAFVLSFPVMTFVKNKIELQYHITYYLGSNPLETNLVAVLISLFSIVALITLLGLLPGRKASKLHARVLLRRIS